MTPWGGLWALTVAGLILLPPVTGWFHEIGHRWLFIFLLSMSISAGVMPVCHWAALRLGIIDRPDDRKRHARPTPKLGGLAIYAAIVGALAANSVMVRGMEAIVAASTMMLVIGLLDDWRGVPAAWRLIVQLTAVGVVVAAGQQLTLFPQTPLGETVNIVLTALWIVGITNAFNFFDGMDGLAGGLAVIIAGFMGIIAFQTRQPLLGWMTVALVGASLGFLLYNWRWGRPAAIFLGDSGASCLGFLLACLAVAGDWSTRDPLVSISNPLLIFGVLIFDMVHITVARLVTGRVRTFREWIDYVGTDHLHHRLLRLFGRPAMAVWFIFLLNMALGLSALELRDATLTEALFLIIQAVIMLTLVTLLEHAQRALSASGR
ncbi:MAG TPA: MraY family glycosyltransferase [Nitrospiria bacterium]|nr:MraY family glycosyltransferase [Nitrospiria bacterium]